MSLEFALSKASVKTQHSKNKRVLEAHLRDLLNLAEASQSPVQNQRAKQRRANLSHVLDLAQEEVEVAEAGQHMLVDTALMALHPEEVEAAYGP